MYNPKTIQTEEQGECITLSPAQIILETIQEDEAIGFVDHHSVQFRGFTNLFISLN